MANTGGNFNPYAFGASTVIGGVTGAIGEQIPLPSISGLNAGQGSYQAVSSGILTKLENGTIQNISWSTAGTIFISESYNGIPATTLDTIVDFAKEAGQGEGGNQSGVTFGGSVWQGPPQSSSTGK